MSGRAAERAACGGGDASPGFPAAPRSPERPQNAGKPRRHSSARRALRTSGLVCAVCEKLTYGGCESMVHTYLKQIETKEETIKNKGSQEVSVEQAQQLAPQPRASWVVGDGLREDSRARVAVTSTRGYSPSVESRRRSRSPPHNAPRIRSRSGSALRRRFALPPAGGGGHPLRAAKRSSPAFRAPPSQRRRTPAPRGEALV